jgi:hypothetical protein
VMAQKEVAGSLGGPGTGRLGSDAREEHFPVLTSIENSG